MHLANFSGSQGGCTLRIRSVYKAGNGEGKSICQGLEGSPGGPCKRPGMFVISVIVYVGNWE